MNQLTSQERAQVNADPSPPVDASLRNFERFMFGVGIVGLIATAVVVTLGLRLVDRTGTTLARSLELTAEAVGAVEQTIAVADETIGIASSGMATLAESVSGAEESLAGAGLLLGDTGVALSQDVPESIDAIRETMPALIQSADLLNSALGALSFLGVDFAPETPPADSLRRVESSLAGIADRLRQASTDLEDLGDGLTGLSSGAGSLSNEIDRLGENLEQADLLLDEYATTAIRTSALVDQTSADLEAQRDEGRLIVILLGLVIALGQVVPLALAWRSRQARQTTFDLGVSG